MSKSLNISHQQTETPELIVTSFDDARVQLNTGNKWPKFDSIISIGDPGSKPPQGFRFVPYRLRLEFDDAVDEIDGENLRLPTEEDIEELISFAKLAKTRGDTRVLIHCQKGCHRSVAAAFIFLCVWLGNGKENFAMQNTVDSCEIDFEQLLPNELMIEIADTLLRREGLLLDTFDKFFPED